MALTADDVAKAFSDAGVDDPAKLAPFLESAALLVTRDGLLRKIEVTRAAQAASRQVYEEQLQDLASQVAAVEAQLRLKA